MLKSLLSPRNYLQAFTEVVHLLTRHRELTWVMTKRELSERYSGQTLGILWSIIHPLVLMGIYIFLFAFVFKIRLGDTSGPALGYVVYILSGLIPWLAFQESMIKSASAIVTNTNLVKQVVFPIEILPAKGVLASLMPQVVATTVLVLYIWTRHDLILWTYILLPLLFLMQVLAMIGVAYVLSSTGAYFRDLKDVVQMLALVGMYIQPVFYTPEMVPSGIRFVLYLNPFSYMAWCYQDVFYHGRIDHPWAWPIMLMMSVVLFAAGYRFFRRLRPNLGSIL